jgi:hypothetical protein
MRVLRNPTRMKKTPLRNVNKRKRRTVETCAPPLKGAPRNARRRVRYNWLAEDNYL